MRSAEERGWIRCSERLPEKGQLVYYFGPPVGLHIGRFDPTVETKGLTVNAAGEEVVVDLPESVVAAINHNKFINNDWGVCDADDAPWWMPYDAERAKSWVPLPPDYVPEDERPELFSLSEAERDALEYLSATGAVASPADVDVLKNFLNRLLQGERVHDDAA